MGLPKPALSDFEGVGEIREAPNSQLIMATGMHRSNQNYARKLNIPALLELRVRIFT